MTSIVGLAAATSFSTTFLFSAYVGYKAAHEQPGDATFDFLMVSPLIGVPSGLLVAAAKSPLTFSSFGWGLMVGVASVPCCIASTYAGIFAGAFLGNSMGQFSKGFISNSSEDGFANTKKDVKNQPNRKPRKNEGQTS